MALSLLQVAPGKLFTTIHSAGTTSVQADQYFLSNIVCLIILQDSHKFQVMLLVVLEFSVYKHVLNPSGQLGTISPINSCNNYSTLEFNFSTPPNFLPQCCFKEILSPSVLYSSHVWTRSMLSILLLTTPFFWPSLLLSAPLIFPDDFYDFDF